MINNCNNFHIYKNKNKNWHFIKLSINLFNSTFNLAYANIISLKAHKQKKKDI